MKDVNRHISFMAAVAATIVVTWASYTLGKSVVGIRGVTTGFLGTDIQLTHNSVEMRVVGTKTKECTYIPESQKGLAWDGNQWMAQNVNFLLLGLAQGNRPKGTHDFGIWRWEFPAMEMISKVAVTVHHNCDGELVSSTIQPFKIR